MTVNQLPSATPASTSTPSEVTVPIRPRELTVRAVISGMLLGVIMCFSNIFVFLKTGWSLGVTVTSVILAFALFRALRGIIKTPFLLLENNAASAVASGAGFMTGGGNMAAMPALLLLTGYRPEGWGMFFWFALIAALGVFVAIPVKRQLIDEDQLPFPTGTATAETLKSLYSDGAAGTGKAKLLGLAALFGGAIAWLRDAKATWMPFNLPHQFTLPFQRAGHTLAEWTLAFEGSLILFAVGGLMGFKAGWSMLLGALINYGYFGPLALENGWITGVSYKQIMVWSLWPGAAMLIAGALTQFAFQWRSVARSFSAFGSILTKGDGDDPREVPMRWFAIGMIVLSPPLVYLMRTLFNIPVWAGVIAIPLGVLMGIVAARVTGETDVTPTKALGPVTQSVFGVLVPGDLTVNIMSANVTGGMGLHAADLLTSLKAGHLVGANARHLLVAQLFGVLTGAVIMMPAFNLIIPDASLLGSEAFPAPSVLVWAGVSKLMVQGFSALPQPALTAAAVAMIVGVLLASADKLLPKRYSRFIPSPASVGIAFVIPGYNSIAMALGSFIAAALYKKKPEFADRTVVSVSSGLIAGESLVGIGIAILIALGVLTR